MTTTDDVPALICSYCDGSGEAGRFGTRRCIACKGTGETNDSADDDAIARAEWLADMQEAS